ncbi:MAG: PilN domain-containing protein [Candidatus Omnitrophica bacterium]|nr:PilN domain-containing protein [Candidatus Omnitrophota bacterium]
MERINLLPDDLAPGPFNRFSSLAEQQFVPTLIRMAAGAAALVFLLAAFHMLMTFRYRTGAMTLKAKKIELEAELERMESTVKRLEQRESALMRQMEWQTRRVEYLRAYQDESSRAAVVLQEIKRALPYGVWLTGMDWNTRKTLKLAGGAFEEDLIVQFMGTLKELPRFRDVAFNFTKKAKVGETGFVEFELVSRVVTLPEPAS